MGEDVVKLVEAAKAYKAAVNNLLADCDQRSWWCRYNELDKAKYLLLLAAQSLGGK